GAEQQKNRAELAKIAAEKQQKEEEALRLVADGNRILYRAPLQALFLATQASQISSSPVSIAAQRSALSVIKQRHLIQIEESKQWAKGFLSLVAPTWFEGR